MLNEGQRARLAGAKWETEHEIIGIPDAKKNEARR